MNVLVVVVACAGILLAGYRFYGNFLSKKVFKLDDSRVTPAVEKNDGLDYSPAPKGMLLGQHFSAIAAAGPITGPILAAVMFGWAPALLWILVGSIFIGGVHDMGSLVASIRNQAKSITEVIRQHVSLRAWILFQIFIWITLVYVIVAFTDTTASSFVGNIDLGNGEMVTGAGIASSSVLYLLVSVLMGLAMKFGRLKEGLATLIFIPLVGVAIWAGQLLPLDLGIADPLMAQKVWGGIILAYCLVASAVPMWLVLQPRGALGGWFLYIALAVCAIGLIFGGYDIQYPAFMALQADSQLGSFWFPMFPVLFITVACGACSGFHSLVSSGTTSKQLNKESDAKPVAYGAMLLEALVAVVSVACVMILKQNDAMIGKSPNFIYAMGIGSFVELFGIPASLGISFGLMAFTTFVYDTLDVCTRLGRYIIEELTGMKGWAGKIISTVLTAGVPLFFIFKTSVDAAGNPIPAWKVFWSTFGATNQLLAALALIGMTVWLFSIRTGKYDRKYLVSLIPAVVMFVMSNWSLISSIYTTLMLGQGMIVVAFISILLVCLSVMVAVESYIALRHSSKARPIPAV